MSVLAAIVCAPLLLGGCGDGLPAASVDLVADASLRRTDAKPISDLRATAPRNELSVRSAAGSTVLNHPFQFGRPFVHGEIPTCPLVLVDGTPSTAQVDVKTRHPDGSVRFALVSMVLAQVPVSGGVSISFRDAGTCASQPPLAAADMLGARFDFDARIKLNGGAAGTVSAREMLSRGHYSLWTSGQVATTALIADHIGKSYDIGVDDHKSLRPVFEVQFWPSIAKTRVRVILESTDTEKVQNQDYDVSVQTGSAAPAEVMSASGVKHNYMSRWTRVFWIGGQPEAVDVDYGLAYLTATRALPNYDPSIRLSANARASILAAWDSAEKGLYGKGLWEKAMPAAGGRSDLGPYPRWMVAWLYEGSAALKNVAMGQADLAAAWPMHLREGSPGKFLDRARTAPALGHPVSGYARPTLAYSDLPYPYTVAADRVKVVGPRNANGWGPDNAHQPQPFFIPYLLTGEHFYGEQMQFWSGYSLLDLPWGLYGGVCGSKNASPEYLGFGGQIRGMAWGLRMVSEAAWAAPDGTPGVQGWLRSAVEDAVTRFEGTRRVVRGNNTERPDWRWASTKGDCFNGRLANANPLRYWNEGASAYGGNPSVLHSEAPWMFSFMMYSLNRAAELGHPAGALRDWLAPFFIGAARHGGITGYHLGDYTIPVLDAQTGALYQSWNDVNAEYTDYVNYKYWSPAANPGNSTNSLAQGYGTAALAALASTYGVPGSAEAWRDFASPHFAGWGWAEDPKWAVMPRTGNASFSELGTARFAAAAGVNAPEPAERAPIGSAPPPAPVPEPAPPVVSPAPPSAPSPSDPEAGGTAEPLPTNALPNWLASSAVFQWTEVPNSRLDSSEAWTNYKAAPGVMGKLGLFAYSGGTVRAKGSELFIAGGGHMDYSGNEIFSIKLSNNQPAWTRRNNPSSPIAENVPYYPDGRRSASHTYWGIQFLDSMNRLMFFGNSAYGNQARYIDNVDGFDPELNDYEPAGTYASQANITGPGGVAVDADDNVYVHSMRDGHLYKWTRNTNSWTKHLKDVTFTYATPYAIDTKRNRMFRPKVDSYRAAYFDLNGEPARVFVEITGPATETLATRPQQVVYDPALDVYWLWARNDSTLYRINAETFTMTAQPVTGMPPSAKYTGGLTNTYGRFNYVPEMRGLVLLHEPSASVYFIRTAP